MRTAAGAMTAIAVLAGSLSLITATPAAAAAYCSSSGYTASGEPMERCTRLDNGTLYHTKRFKADGSTAAITTYSKTAGSTVTVSLGYTGVNGTQYGSSMSISTGETKLKSFHMGYGHYECTSSVGLMKWGSTVYETPSAHC